MSLPESLRVALGRVIADERAEWRRQVEVMAAEHRAAIAEMRAAHAQEIQALRDIVAQRLAEIRDGTDGAPGRDGADAPALTAEQLDEAVARHMAANPLPVPQDGAPGRDGVDGREVDPEAVRDMVQKAVAAAVAALPPPRDGMDGAPGRDGRDGVDGAPGRFPVARAWRDEVHYSGDVVTHAGGTWQAVRDTGREPPHEDWVCLAAPGAHGDPGPAGAGGRTLEFRGAWTATSEYHAHDVAMVNGSSFVALRDDPGPCPGDGWRLLASAGAKGRTGEPGQRGAAGASAPGVVAAVIDDTGMLTLRNGDGTEVHVDLVPLLTSMSRG